ncbi:MAG: SpoIIE family protein phosphatase [Acidobacteriota bacterium]
MSVEMMAKTHGTTQLSVEVKFQLMMELARKISSSLDLDAVLDLIIDTVRSFIHYDSAGIYIIESHGKERHVKAHTSRGYDKYLQPGCIHLKVGDGIVGWAVKTGMGVIVPDVTVDNRYISARAQTRSEMVAPIRANCKVIGAFNLECDRLSAYTKMDLEMLMFFANQAAISIEKAMLHKALVEKERMQAELAVAHRVQQSLLPTCDPVFGHFEIAGLNCPTKEVGGDYFDFIKVSENRLGVVIADVSGKGVPAALIMASFRASLRAQICNECSLERNFNLLNRLLHDSTAADQFVTACYLDLRYDCYGFTYLNAGHNPILLVRPDNSYELFNEGNIALGLFPDRYYSGYRHTVAPGDTLLLYTDGITETLRGSEEFGVERLATTVIKYRQLPARELISAVYDEACNFAEHAQLEDDCTIVAIKVN